MEEIKAKLLPASLQKLNTDEQTITTSMGNSTEMINIAAELHLQVQIANKYLEKVQSVSVDTPERYKKVFSLIERIQAFYDKSYAARTQYTRKMTAIAKVYTQPEGELLEVKKKLQGFANEYAAKERAIELEKQKIADAALQAKKDLVDRKVNIKALLNARILKYLERVQEHAGKYLADLTPENADATKTALGKKATWGPKHDLSFRRTEETYPQDVFQEIADEVREVAVTFYETKAADIMSDALGLVDIQLSKPQEAKRIQEAMEADLTASTEAMIEQGIAEGDAEKAFAEIDQGTAEIVENKVVRSTAKVEIEILSNIGYLKCVSFWFATDPLAKTGDISRKTFKQCITFCNKIANKKGIRIEDPSLRYIDVITAKK